jgi:aspartate/methionine/tyrosine aminotransferase
MFTPADRIKDVKKSATRRLYDAAPAGSINFGLGEPDFRAPAVARREAIRVIEEEHIGYTANAGLLSLREKIADYHRESFCFPLTADSVCVTTGVEEALFAIVMAMANPGDEVLLPDPGFNAYPVIAEIAGARVTRYRLPAARGFLFDRDSFDQAVTDKTKLVFILSPSNPTSRVISRDDLQFIAERLKKSNAFVVSDEIYRDLFFEERPASISEFHDRVIVVAGLSKMMSMTGWRLGWAVGNEEVIRYITVMHQYISSCANAVSQKAALTAFSEEGRAATQEFRLELKRRGEVMARAVERETGLPFVAGEGAYYIMLDVSRFGSSEEVAWALLEERVITVPGDAFGMEGAGFLRLSFSIDAELIEEGVRRVARGLEKMKPSRVAVE